VRERCCRLGIETVNGRSADGALHGSDRGPGQGNPERRRMAARAPGSHFRAPADRAAIRLSVSSGRVAKGKTMRKRATETDTALHGKVMMVTGANAGILTDECISRARGAACRPPRFLPGARGRERGVFQPQGSGKEIIEDLLRSERRPATLADQRRTHTASHRSSMNVAACPPTPFCGIVRHPRMSGDE
jgi:hypothetical protein